MKWSKILINSVPTSVTATRGPWTPDECHCALVAHNPSYTSLNVTKKPSWVHTPSAYTQGTLSSLVVAFEDPDGSAKATPLSNHPLYLFGARAKVSCWKQTASPPPTIPTPTAPAATDLLGFSTLASTPMEEDTLSQVSSTLKCAISSSPLGPKNPSSST